MHSRVRHGDSLPRKQAVLHLATVESVFALNAAFFVNSAILIMSAATFANGHLAEYSLEAAHETLEPLMGPVASFSFAIALLASGLASSTTATIAGQIIMQGFIHREINVWLRRLITMVPSMIVIIINIDPLKILIFSQVALSFQLPFAVLPLVYFTSREQLMGTFVNSKLTMFVCGVISLIIIALNIVLLVEVGSSV
jgi:manganese transport protein